MLTAFRETEFRTFAQGAHIFFPESLSDEALFDPLERRRHFDWAWQAVRYRYSLCADCNEEFHHINAKIRRQSNDGHDKITVIMNQRRRGCVQVEDQKGHGDREDAVA